MKNLQEIQEWFLSIIISTGSIQEKLDAAEKKYQVSSDNIIAKSKQLAIEDRLNIYSKGYVIRLMECMKGEYPLLNKLLGQELFEHFASAFLRHQPSLSYSLFDLGARFPAFLKAAVPVAAQKKTMYQLPYEIAILERAKTEVYRMKGIENQQLTPSLSLIDSISINERSHLLVSPAISLQSSPFDIIAYTEALENDKTTPTLKENLSYYAVNRHQYRIQCLSLEAWQWQFLTSLQKTQHIKRAVDECCQAEGIATEQFWARALFWWEYALQLGLIYQVR